MRKKKNDEVNDTEKDENQDENQPQLVSIPREEDEDEIPEKDINDVLAELGQDVEQINIFKKSEKPPINYEYVTRIPVRDWDLELIKNTYGGGTYRARFLDKNGKYKKQCSFFISGMFKAEPESIKANYIPPREEHPQVSELGEIKKLLELQTHIIQNLTTNSQQPKSDPMEIALKMAELITKNTRPADTPSQSIGFQQMMEIFKQGLDIGRHSEGGTDFLDFAQTMVTPVLDTIKQYNENGQKILEKAKGEGNPKMKKEKPKTFNDYLKMGIPQFLGLAKNGKDPALYASLMLDQVPQGWYEDIFKSCSEPMFFDSLVTLNPDVKNYESWFRDFIDNVKESLTPETVEGNES